MEYYLQYIKGNISFLQKAERIIENLLNKCPNFEMKNFRHERDTITFEFHPKYKTCTSLQEHYSLVSKTCESVNTHPVKATDRKNYLLVEIVN